MSTPTTAQAETQHARLTAALHRIWHGPDGPGRRFLERLAKFETHDPECLGGPLEHLFIKLIKRHNINLHNLLEINL